MNNVTRNDVWELAKSRRNDLVKLASDLIRIPSENPVGTQRDVIDFVEKLKSKNKIIILDCCYSGKFYVSGAKQMKLEEAITTFAGNGTVVLASSSSNESSWLGPGKNHSLYTGMLTTAMTVNRRIHKGKIFYFLISMRKY